MNRPLLNPLIPACALLLLFFGCRSITPSVSYYTMRTLQEESTTQALAPNGSHRTIGIRNVLLPHVINRTQMVRRSGNYAVKIDNYHRWAEYPDRMVLQLLQGNLQRLLPGSQVVKAPWGVGREPEVTLSFHFLELIGSTDRKMELDVVWTLLDGQKPSLTRRTHLIESTDGDGFEDLARAHSRLLAELSREVAETIAERNDQP